MNVDHFSEKVLRLPPRMVTPLIQTPIPWANAKNYQVSISSTFYIRRFHMKVLCAAFLLIQFGFAVFWCKNSGTKAACKISMKLTTGWGN